MDDRTWSQIELDKQYSPSAWTKRMDPSDVVSHHVNFIRKGTARAQKNLESSSMLDIPYSCASSCCYDIYSPKDTNGASSVKRMVVFIHGGYWKALDKDDCGWFAERVVESGASLAVLNYSLCPEAGSISKIVLEIKKAFAHLNKKYPNVPTCVIGHSAGAHLAAMVALCSDDSDVPIPNLSELVLISGVYDLEPIRRSCENEELQLNEGSSTLLSPLHQLSNTNYYRSDVVIRIIVAEHDSPAFHSQSEAFFKLLKAKSFNLDENMSPTIVKNVDHFDIMEKLEDGEFELTKLLFSKNK